MKRAMATLAAVVIASAAAQEQGGKPPVERGGSVGVTVDVGSVLRGATRLLVDRSNKNYVAGEIVVAWSTADTTVDLDALAREVDAAVRARSALTSLGIEVAVLAVPPERVEEALSRLRAGPGLMADRHAIAQPLTSAGRLYAAALINATGAQALAREVRIGLIDGALPADVPLAAKVEERRFVEGVPDDSRHAAAVACLIACRADPDSGFSGLLQGAAIYAADVLRADGERRIRSDTFAIARALDWLLAERCEVVNISLGGPGDAVLALAVRQAVQRGLMLVAAAGNGERSGKPTYPAAYPEVIAVTAVDLDAQPWPKGTRGEYVAMAAPGVDLWLPLDGGRYLTGTSYAAPFVTAALAARLATNQPATAAALCETARDLPPAGRDAQTGCGLLRWPAQPTSGMHRCTGDCGFPDRPSELKKTAAGNDSRMASELTPPLAADRGVETTSNGGQR